MKLVKLEEWSERALVDMSYTIGEQWMLLGGPVPISSFNIVVSYVSDSMLEWEELQFLPKADPNELSQVSAAVDAMIDAIERGYSTQITEN